MQGRSLFRRFMVAAGLLIVIALCAVAFAQTGNSGQLLRTSAPASTPPPVYQRWLNEDVAYIITPEERAEFLKVQTADGRDQFIVQFWLRRDPTPNTPENEFKEEHYRRIAFA